MLWLNRKHGETIRIGDRITIVIEQGDDGLVHVGIEAPRDTRILRGELAQRIDSGSTIDRACGSACLPALQEPCGIACL